jgi:hypothetical protein
VLAVERRVQRDAEREQIRTRVDGLAAELLGRHVGGRSHEDAGRGEVHILDGAGVVAGERDAEVGHRHVSVGPEEHVVGLEVAVNDPRRVRRGEAATCLDEGLEDLRDRATSLGEPLPQRRPLDVLHRDVEAAGVGAGVVHGDDVRASHAGHGARLALQALLELGRGAAQDLQRHLAVEVGIVGRIDQPDGACPLPSSPPILT